MNAGKILLVTLILAVGGCATSVPKDSSGVLVFQSDFGLADGAVAAMHGVALTVDPDLRIEDLTHEIPAYDIWAGAYRLRQSAAYFPAGTVFVSVVDPGVGTNRRSVVARIGDQYFVTPDNGTLSLVGANGIAELREIDENVNRMRGSTDSHTFHGRDVYAYTGARLAAGRISFAEVGPALDPGQAKITRLTPATSTPHGAEGSVPILDVRYGNVWTNVGRGELAQAGIRPGTHLAVEIRHLGRTVYNGEMPFSNTFGDVDVGMPLAYLNSLEQLAFAINQGNFSSQHGVGSGPAWRVFIEVLN